MASPKRESIEELTNLLEFSRSQEDEDRLNYLIKNGNNTNDAAAAWGITPRSVRLFVARLKRIQTRAGKSPEYSQQHPAAEGMVVKSKWDVYNKDGEQVVDGISYHADANSIVDQTKEIIEALTSEIPPSKNKPKIPKFYRKDLMTEYVLGDPHFGLYAWSEECGEDFDTAIASADLKLGMDLLVDAAPQTEIAVIENLGDFFHADNLESKTARSGNVLDCDTRLPRVWRVGIDALCYLVEKALEKAKKVEVYNITGNHDDLSSYALALAVYNRYRDNQRVEVCLEYNHFHYLKFGANLIGLAHGHNRIKPQDYGPIMADDCPIDWGESDFRVWRTGHVHHDQRKEFTGFIFESYQTLAAKDAYHHAHGYRSKRSMSMITTHKEFGEIDRRPVSIEQIHAMQGRKNPKRRANRLCEK